ncbi:GNAT family N-acetyltransferase [Virgibacillus kekensis]|uniref:GNAT family N-acetyltransferase n=1 Tax=Virgibacillus kekensis TaxID=202261 RepID=A0ABV9DRE6_9BACI
MEFKEMETERLWLVKITDEHTQRYFDIMSNDDVTRYYGMNSLESIEEAERLIKSFRVTFENRRGARWGLVWKDTGEFIGTVGLNNLNLRSKKAEVGFELHPDYWQKGITTEAVKAVLRYAFEELNLYRMGAVTFPQNKASITLLERIGFQKEGLLRGYLYQNDRSHDVLIFSLLSTEYAERKW